MTYFTVYHRFSRSVCHARLCIPTIFLPALCCLSLHRDHKKYPKANRYGEGVRASVNSNADESKIVKNKKMKTKKLNVKPFNRPGEMPELPFPLILIFTRTGHDDEEEEEEEDDGPYVPKCDFTPL